MAEDRVKAAGEAESDFSQDQKKGSQNANRKLASMPAVLVSEHTTTQNSTFLPQWWPKTSPVLTAPTHKEWLGWVGQMSTGKVDAPKVVTNPSNNWAQLLNCDWLTARLSLQQDMKWHVLVADRQILLIDDDNVTRKCWVKFQLFGVIRRYVSVLHQRTLFKKSHGNCVSTEWVNWI